MLDAKPRSQSESPASAGGHSRRIAKAIATHDLLLSGPNGCGGSRAHKRKLAHKTSANFLAKTTSPFHLAILFQCSSS